MSQKTQPSDHQLALFSSARAPSNRLIVLNCGLGRDSMTMLALASEGRLEVDGVGPIGLSDLDAVVFSDTGAEWDHTYALIPAVQEILSGSGVPFIVLRKPRQLDAVGKQANGRNAPRTDTWAVDSMADVISKAAAGGYHYRLAIKDDYGSRLTVVGFKGDCTAHHKIGPMRRLLNDLSFLRFGLKTANGDYGRAVDAGTHAPHLALVGLAADEAKRIARALTLEGTGPKYVREVYPLATMGISKSAEAQVLARHDLAHVRKSGCDMCKYQPPSWYWALSVSRPERFAAIVAYEAAALARNPRMAITGAKRTDGTPMPITEVVALWRSVHPRATVASVLDKEYGRESAKAAKARRDAELRRAPRAVRLPVVSAQGGLN